VSYAKDNDFGLVHCHTGDGPGKTRSAFGLALRAIGHGYEAHVVQFLKGNWLGKAPFGEVITAKGIERLHITRFGTGKLFREKGDITELDKKQAKRGLDHVKELYQKSGPKLVILDEINIALYYDILKTEEILELIEDKPESVELVLTGEKAPEGIKEKADYLIEYKKLKHPYDEGIEARKGIEY
jgi:cob(I)alamin adenosyltransferase